MSVQLSAMQGNFITFTPQINATPPGVTPNYANVNDPYVADTVAGFPFPNGAFVPPGLPFFWTDPNGRPIVLKYVRYNPTANVTLSASNVPGVVYWKDETKTVVTPTFSESVLDVTGCEAGILLNAGVTNGNWTIIQCAGFLASCNVPASTAKGDALIGGDATALVLARVAAGTAPTAQVVAWSWGAVSGGLADVNLALPITG